MICRALGESAATIRLAKIDIRDLVPMETLIWKTEEASLENFKTRNLKDFSAFTESESKQKEKFTVQLWNLVQLLYLYREILNFPKVARN